MKPLVSVVIPTRNRSLLVQEAVESVLAQEDVGVGFDLEVVVVDDASSDETPALMRNFPQIRYIRLEINHGEGPSRNVGIKASSGKYIAFLDDDDLMLPQRLKLQVPAIEAHPEVGVVYSQNVMRGPGVQKWWPDAVPAPSGEGFDKLWPDATRAPSGDVFSVFLKEEFLSMDTLLVRRSAFEKAGLFSDLPTGAHYDMFLRLAFHVPFLFVEGNVAVNRVNLQGVFHARLAGEDGYGNTLPKVVDRALAMLPDSVYSRELRKEVHEALVPRLICMVERIEDIEGVRSYIQCVLKACPWLLTEPMARNCLPGNAHYLVRSTRSPLGALRVICAELKAAAPTNSLKSWYQTRLLLGELWMAAAVDLGFRSDRFKKTAVWAAGRALLYAPGKGLMDFCKLLLRVVVGANVYNQLKTLRYS